MEELQRRLEAGETLRQIGDAFGVCHKTVKRKLSPAQLELAERNFARLRQNLDPAEIQRRLDAGETLRQIGRELGTCDGTVKSRLSPQQIEQASRNFEKFRHEHAKRKWENPDTRRRMIEHMQDRYDDPEYMAWQTERLQRLWDNPEHRRQQSERTQTTWEDPEFRRKNIEGRWSEEQRQEQSQRMRELINDPAVRLRIQEWNSSPENLQRLRELNQTPERRNQQSEFMKRYWSERDFWTWLRSFPEDKQKQILQAMFTQKFYRTHATSFNLKKILAGRRAEPIDLDRVRQRFLEGATIPEVAAEFNVNRSVLYRRLSKDLLQQAFEPPHA